MHRGIVMQKRIHTHTHCMECIPFAQILCCTHNLYVKMEICKILLWFCAALDAYTMYVRSIICCVCRAYECGMNLFVATLYSAKREKWRIFVSILQAHAIFHHYFIPFSIFFVCLDGRLWSADVHCIRKHIMCEYNRNSLQFEKIIANVADRISNMCARACANVHQWHLVLSACIHFNFSVACKFNNC